MIDTSSMMKQRETAIHGAAKFGHGHICKYLLSKVPLHARVYSRKMTTELLILILRMQPKEEVSNLKLNAIWNTNFYQTRYCRE